MKILCETQVHNRDAQQQRLPRAVKATLAVGFKKNKDSDGDSRCLLELIHFTPFNKLGTRYKVHNNINKVFTRFIKDGKATISFIEPPTDLMIKCDPIQLKAFLQTLKHGIEGKSSSHLMTNILSATAIPQKAQPQLKMVVLKRSDYPTKGFPKSLVSLKISDIQLAKVTFEICSLRNLTSLDLSNNKLTKLPSEIGRLSLLELRLSHNALGEADNWQWLDGRNLQGSLRELDLSANKITFFPFSLVKMEELIHLKLNNNSIKIIPFAIRRLRHLRFLHISSNLLESLPSTFNRIRLDMLDVWGNNFLPHLESSSIIFDASLNVLPLWLLAARAVNCYKLPYSSAVIPWDLAAFLSEAPECCCGKVCSKGVLLPRAAIVTFENLKNLVFCRDRHVYADILLCGPYCAGRKYISRP